MRRSGGNLTAFFLLLSLLVTAAWARSYLYVTEYHCVRIGPAPAGRYRAERSWVGLGNGCLYLGGYTNECQGYGVAFVQTTNDRMFWRLPMAAGRYLCPTPDWKNLPGAWTLVRDALGFCVVCHRQVVVEPPSADEAPNGALSGSQGEPAASTDAESADGPPHVTELRRGWLLGVPCWFVLAMVLLPAGWRWPLALPQVAGRVWHLPGEMIQFAATFGTAQPRAGEDAGAAPPPLAAGPGCRDRKPPHFDSIPWQPAARLRLEEHRLRVRHAHWQRAAAADACPGLLPRRSI